jgi:DNA repair exonuclease SbcCD ATPase subunit
VASLPVADPDREPAVFPDCAVYAATRAVLAGEDEQEREIKVYSVPFDRDHLLYSNYLPILSVLFSRSVIDAGVRFDESFDLFEDWDFWLQVSRQIPFTSIPDITCVYRLHEQASGVHSAARTASAYQAIYKKWLADYVSADFYALLHKTHAWHTEAIAALQAINQAKMEAIGQQHSHAISVIGLKDINIAALQEAFNHALGVVAEKDEAIKQLTTSYAHAIEVINEKDRASAKAAQEYQHAIAVIQEKDQATAKLLQEYQHAIAVIQEKDQATGKLLQDYHHAIAVIQEKDEATAKLLQEYHHAITVIQEKDQATAKLLQEYHQATELIQEKDQATAQLQRDLKLSVEVVETNQRTIAQLKQEVMALTAQVERLRERINNPIKWHANRLLGRNDDKEE